MTGDLFLSVSESIAAGLLTLAVLLALIRLLAGSTLADRILALDLLSTLAISLIGVAALRTGSAFQLDIALALCLVGFLATIALTRYILSQAAAAAAPRDDDAEVSTEARP